MGEPVTTTVIGMGISIKAGIMTVIAGVLGATVSLKFATKLSKWEKATTITAGAILAHFLSNPIAVYFSLSEYHETIGFLVGLFGLSICAALIDLIKRLDIPLIVSDIMKRYMDK